MSKAFVPQIVPVDKIPDIFILMRSFCFNIVLDMLASRREKRVALLFT